jgi:hypothetical protein
LIALGFEHGRHDFADGFFVVHDKNVFEVHYGWLPVVIIRDGTGECGVLAQSENSVLASW